MKSSNIYKQKFDEYGVSPKALLWKSRGAAHQRFRQFWKEIDFSGKRVLDIGCGFGEMGKFLLKRYEGVSYTGIDMVSEFIDTAKKEVPGGNFFVADYLTDKIKGDYNVVIASGVLNSNKNDSGEANLEFRKMAIKRMFDLTSNTLAFNMLGSSPARKNSKGSNIWYSDSLKILEYCMSLTRRVVLRANYHPSDFTIIMTKVK